MQKIRHVAIGRFQRNIYKELDNLPFIITKDGQDYCVVTKPFQVIAGKQKGAVNVSPGMPLEGLKPLPEDGTMLAASPTGKCETIQVNCRNIGKAYRVTIPADEGEKKNDMFLCDLHLKRAKDHGMEIAEL